MLSRDRLLPTSVALVSLLAVAGACGGSTTSSSGAAADGGASTGATVTGGGGATGAGGGSATSTATAAGGFGGWGTGEGCPAAAAASPFGDPAGACATCMASGCGAVIAVCFGPAWASGSYAGSCADFQRCLCACLDGGGDATSCGSTCAPRITQDCTDCSPVLSKCQAEQCATECAGGKG